MDLHCIILPYIILPIFSLLIVFSWFLNELRFRVCSFEPRMDANKRECRTEFIPLLLGSSKPDCSLAYALMLSVAGGSHAGFRESKGRMMEGRIILRAWICLVLFSPTLFSLCLSRSLLVSSCEVGFLVLNRNGALDKQRALLERNVIPLLSRDRASPILAQKFGMSLVAG